MGYGLMAGYKFYLSFTLLGGFYLFEDWGIGAVGDASFFLFLAATWSRLKLVVAFVVDIFLAARTDAWRESPREEGFPCRGFSGVEVRQTP